MNPDDWDATRAMAEWRRATARSREALLPGGDRAAFELHQVGCNALAALQRENAALRDVPGALTAENLADALGEIDGPGNQLRKLSYQEIAAGVLARLTRLAQLAAQEQAETDRRARIGRLAREAQAERYPSWCIRHQRLLSWQPFPIWWYHADGHEQIAENAACAFMRNSRAPEGKV